MKRVRVGETLGVAFVLAALACACGGAGDDGAGLQRRATGAPRTPSESSTKDDGADVVTAPAPTPSAETPAPEPEPPTTPADTDKDGVPDAKDCDPQNAAIVGTKLIDDALAADAAHFAPSAGFPAASWGYATEAYRQARLVNGADATLFKKDAFIKDVDITVAASSTEVTSTITPRLRQMFVLLGARTEGAVFTAYGCGVEVVQGMSPEQQTSIVKLSGTPDAIVTTAIQRTPRNVLLENEGFSIRAQVKGGKVTCSVSQGAGAVTTAEAAGIADIEGSIGFYTRQTKAAFKNIKACKLL
jgi:hypothetical protein